MKGEGIFGKFFIKNEELWYSIFRVIIGLVFLLHGLSKFGVFGKTPMPLLSLMGAAGTIEIIAGILIIVGLWTRLAALISCVEMIVAWFMAHVSAKGWNPLFNGGEAALLFIVIFLVLLVHGGGKYSMEHLIHKKEVF